MKIKCYIILFLLLYNLGIYAQISRNNNQYFIKWTGIRKTKINETDSISLISFENASFKNHLPYFYKKIALQDNYSYSATLTNEQYKECSNAEIKLIPAKYINEKININSNVTSERKKPFLCVSFLPFRKNTQTGNIEKLISFNIEIVKNNNVPKQIKKRTYAQNSVLASGNWYKIAVSSDGVYKLTYSDLQNLGINVNSIDPKNIRIYGNGGGMLSENNFDPRNDDLVENAIYVSSQTAGTFSNNDYILFYGESPIRWNYNTSDKKYHHQINYYSDATYYFINVDIGPGKRIAQQASSTNSANKFISKFDDYSFHEKDSLNLIISGKEWYGECFDYITSHSFNFVFPNIDNTSRVYVRTDIASRYNMSSQYTSNANGHIINSTIPAYSGNYQYACTANDTITFIPSSSAINVTVSKSTANAVGWLNYIELNATRNLVFSSPQMTFRSYASVGSGNISQFTLSNVSSNVSLWDVTDPLNVKNQLYSLNNNNAVYSISTDSLKQFIAFDGLNFYSPNLIGKIANQNLHALGQADLIIITYPDYISEAQQIASIHNLHDNLSSIIVTPYQIYNEFSSGEQDVSAIRDFVKMFYDRAGSNENEMPKYILLFGDASYDYKDRISNNTNFVPTFESTNGVDAEASYATDDFFGFLDDNEGPYTNSLLDIGIGRFPVKSTEDANTMINKINQYLTINNPNATNTACSNLTSLASGDWRNTVCFVAGPDDEGFFSDCELFSSYLNTNYIQYNIDKIYCDAYIETFGAGGQRFPDVNTAIDNRVAKGALIINYVGHGGELGWALERILTVSDILSWTNINSMPMFLTATCEFSRYDNPAQVSAGEYVFTNPGGGGIALLTTSRVANEGSNQTLCSQFYKYAFAKINGIYPTLGYLNMMSKNGVGGVENFILLGDPALKLSYPENNVVTTYINGHKLGLKIDTLKAFDKATISGIIQDPSGQKLSNFNGVVYPTVYDKKAILTTFSNDPDTAIQTFCLQKNILYKGKVSVINGNFSFTFIVPKDIAYNYGIGRISYYAEDGKTNANGYYENSNFIIGGSKTNVLISNSGPKVNLYLNDSNFVYGGITNEKPILLAYLSDSSGINTVGNGIGHDITAILDNNTENSINLNDYYEANLNSYQKGVVRYPFSNLSNGTHTLKLKAWDIYDNSTEESTEFVVAQSANLALDNVLNYPNPFTTHTQFMFEHNQPCCTLDVRIQIYTITGKLIKTIERTVQTIGYRAEPIDWDGLDDFGDPIGKGVYIYKIKVKDINGSTAEKIDKLVILR